MPSGVTGTGLPSASPTPSQSVTAIRAIALAKTSARASSEAVGGQRFDGRVVAGRHHQRGGERRDAEAHAMAEVEPARLGREVEFEHDRETSYCWETTKTHLRG